jgi:hypothetical protein
MTQQVAITTVDNPYSPFTQFDEWNAFDLEMGYGTCAYLARIVRSSDQISVTDQDLALEYGIDEIISEDVLGLYKKVSADNTTQKVETSE